MSDRPTHSCLRTHRARGYRSIFAPMDALTTMTYAASGRIARITLNRPERGNGLTLQTPRELSACVEEANLDPNVHVIALSGNGKGFCGGYDLYASAEQGMTGQPAVGPAGSPLDPTIQRENHDPAQTWDPVVDYQMMSRNVRGFMSLFHSDKPVVCKVHGFCVAGGTDLALCSDLLVIEDTAKMRVAGECGGLDDLDTITRTIESSGGLEYTARLARREMELAIEALGRLPESAHKQALRALAEFAVERSY